MDKTSPSQIPFYLDVIDYFFDDDDLASVASQKSKVDTPSFGKLLAAEQRKKQRVDSILSDAEESLASV